MDNFFELYDRLISGLSICGRVTACLSGECWTSVETASSFGMAMTTPVDTAPRMLSRNYIRMPLVQLAESCYETIADEAQWQSLSAVAQGHYYETPYGPYGWLSSPPAVQRYLGMLWLGELLYPEYTEYDLQEAVTGYYKLFYGCELTDDMYRELTANALP